MERQWQEVSVIIPVWRNDWGILSSRVLEWVSYPGVKEIVVAYSGHAGVLPVHGQIRSVCVAHPGRGGQMNAGARVAKGEILLFHHVDSELESGHLSSLQAAMTTRPEMVGGGFHRKFDERHPMLMFLEPIERWHCEGWGTIYGDQSIFARKTVFDSLGGFPELPLMEDVAFSKALRTAGPLAVLDPPMKSSPRKHLEQGPWRTTLRNAWFLLLFQSGVSAEWIYNQYYGASARIPAPDRELAI